MRGLGIGLGALAVLLAGIAYLAVYGGRGSALGPLAALGGAVALLPGREGVRQALRAAAMKYGRPPDWYEALGWVESRWDNSAVGDAGRSVGATQIQKATLVRNGYAGDPMDLTRDPALMADWTIRLSLAGAYNAEGVRLGATPETPSDLAAWWNAGRQSFADPSLPDRTRNTYAPQLIAAIDSLGGGEEPA